MFVDMRAVISEGMVVDTRTEVCADICRHARASVFVDMHAEMCVDMCVDIYTDM